jgi:hypothetical protein
MGSASGSGSQHPHVSASSASNRRGGCLSVLGLMVFADQLRGADRRSGLDFGVFDRL